MPDLKQYTPIFSDDSYDRELHEEIERDRRWGEDEEDEAEEDEGS